MTTTIQPVSTFTCLACTATFAEPVDDDECPECGSPDVDVTVPAPVKARRGGSRQAARFSDDYAGAFDGFTVTSDADMGL
jgi:hypothetical protein